MNTQIEYQTQPVFTERTTCRSCGSRTLIHVLSLGEQYLCAFPETQDSSLPKAPLELVRCGVCGLLQLLHTVSRDLMYREYWYRSSINQTMRDALKDVVRSVGPFQTEGTWLDIGANDGCLLSHVPDSFTRVACEPASTFSAQLHEHADHVIPTYFSKTSVNDYSAVNKFDVITSCAMFYDIDDPGSFVRDIHDCLTDDGVWVNQLNDAPTMLEKNAFDSICHEHLTYWDLASLWNLYRDNGLQIIRVTNNEVNGGSMRVFAKRSARPLEFGPNTPKITTLDVSRFANRIPRWKRLTKDLLSFYASRSGPIWAYGASTKFSTMLQYLDARECFHKVADRNHAKHGRMMVGSWLPIDSEDNMRAARPPVLFCGPWAFRNEFVAREAELRDSGTTMLFPLADVSLIL